MKCPKCKSGEIMRVQRRGLYESRLLSRFGFFPWQCLTCLRRVRVRERGWSGKITAGGSGGATR